ncbi:hypothetical protein [Terrisporobacter muris]|uniref:Uncharacterized protein n=1 Tax=Terrisporobacter muris TaxID=2963284 RepID=A0A9X2MGR5_9FIRM|nr:hypothetical protein [Terrisporobacter muris]MCR1823836.1 hypothetical protein [Terrisporobacter muris]
MSNISILNWNTIEENEYTLIRDNNNIKTAQQNVKRAKNPLADKMFATVIKSYMTNRPVMSDVADVINTEWSMIKKVDNLNESIKKLLDSIFYSDLKNMFFECDEKKVNLWIIIEEKNFSNTKKYIRTIREVSKENDLEVEYLIFDLEDKDKVMEQLNMENRNFTEYI